MMREYPRNLDLERLRTQIPAEGVFGLNPRRLSRFAEERADDPNAGESAGGPVLYLPQRDFGLETREELADARNYTVWWRQQVDLLAAVLIRNGTDVNAVRAAIDHGIAGVAYAYHHIERACVLQGQGRS